jgi:hypothetical protein
MKLPIIKYGEYWILGKSIIGIAIFPFIFLKKSYFESMSYQKEERLSKTINHEKIHIKQQIELLVIPFYILYFLFYFLNLFKKGDAYRNIPFEKEAYANEYNYEYLGKRKLFSWVNYIKKGD